MPVSVEEVEHIYTFTPTRRREFIPIVIVLGRILTERI